MPDGTPDEFYNTRRMPIVFWEDEDARKTEIPRHVGVELEFAGFRRRVSGPYDYDGLSYDEAFALKREIMTYGADPGQDHSQVEVRVHPGNGEMLVDRINGICRLLQENHAFVTAAAGTHIHVDVRDLSPQGIRKVMIAYGRSQMTWLKTQPRARVVGRYCKPVPKDWHDGLQRLPVPRDLAMARIMEKASLQGE